MHDFLGTQPQRASTHSPLPTYIVETIKTAPTPALIRLDLLASTCGVAPRLHEAAVERCRSDDLLAGSR